MDTVDTGTIEGSLNMENEKKRCTKCGELKPVECFYKRPKNTSGLDSWCRDCYAAAKRKRYWANPEKYRQESLAWHQKNPEKANKKNREWAKKNPDNRRKAIATYYQKNAKKLAKKTREYNKKNWDKKLEWGREWKRANPEKTKETWRRWREANLDEVRRRGNEREARKRAENPGYRIQTAIKAGIHKSLRGQKAGRKWELLVGYTNSELMAHLESLFLPGMTWENYGEWHIDHIKPISSFTITSAEDDGFMCCWALENLQPLWAIDNLKKGARLDRMADQGITKYGG
jgi:hypothetical protein